MYILADEGSVNEFPDAVTLSRYVLDLVTEGFADRNTPYPLTGGGSVRVSEDTVTVVDADGAEHTNRF